MQHKTMYQAHKDQLLGYLTTYIAKNQQHGHDDENASYGLRPFAVLANCPFSSHAKSSAATTIFPRAVKHGTYGGVLEFLTTPPYTYSRRLAKRHAPPASPKKELVASPPSL